MNILRYRSAQILAVLTLGLPATGGRAAEGPPRRITVVFRYDDYSDQTPTDLETRIIHSFGERHLRVTFATVPFTCTQDVQALPALEKGLSRAKALILKTALEAGTVDVALHGYCHRSVQPPGSESEFQGVDFRTQMQELARGKSYLEEALQVPVNEFIPPWNSYDRNTIKALEQLDFKLLSAEVPGDSPSSSTLMFLPATTGLRQLRRAVATARRSPFQGQIIVAPFHRFDFLERNPQHGRLSYADFEDLLDWTASQSDVQVRSLSDIVGSGINLGAGRLAENDRIHYCYFELLPPPVRLLFGKPTKVYWTRETNLSLTLSLFLAGSYFILVAFSALAGASAMVLASSTQRWKHVKKAIEWCGLLLLLAAAAYSTWNLEPDYGSTIPLAIIFGIWVGACGAAVFLRGRRPLAEWRDSRLPVTQTG
jgi:peptidoglycan/xylan/chitin deacetylase (PgdA/CDA1 family)